VFLESSEPATFYGPIDVQQKTLVRQVLVDVIIMIENIVMLVIARTTDNQELYHLSLIIIITSYIFAISLKMVFYLW